MHSTRLHRAVSPGVVDPYGYSEADESSITPESPSLVPAAGSGSLSTHSPSLAAQQQQGRRQSHSLHASQPLQQNDESRPEGRSSPPPASSGTEWKHSAERRQRNEETAEKRHKRQSTVDGEDTIPSPTPAASPVHPQPSERIVPTAQEKISEIHSLLSSLLSELPPSLSHVSTPLQRFFDQYAAAQEKYMALKKQHATLKAGYKEIQQQLQNTTEQIAASRATNAISKDEEKQSSSSSLHSDLSRLHSENVRLKQKCVRIQELAQKAHEENEALRAAERARNGAWGGSLLLGGTGGNAGSAAAAAGLKVPAAEHLKSQLAVAREELANKIAENETIHQRRWNEAQEAAEREKLLTAKMSDLKAEMQAQQRKIQAAEEEKSHFEELLRVAETGYHVRVATLTRDIESSLSTAASDRTVHAAQLASLCGLLRRLQLVWTQQGELEDEERLRAQYAWADIERGRQRTNIRRREVEGEQKRQFDSVSIRQSPLSAAASLSSRPSFFHPLYSCLFHLLEELLATFQRIKSQLTSVLRYWREMKQKELNQMIAILSDATQMGGAGTAAAAAGGGGAAVGVGLGSVSLLSQPSAPSTLLSSDTSASRSLPPASFPQLTSSVRSQLASLNQLLIRTETNFERFAAELAALKQEVQARVRWTNRQQMNGDTQQQKRNQAGKESEGQCANGPSVTPQPEPASSPVVPPSSPSVSLFLSLNSLVHSFLAVVENCAAVLLFQIQNLEFQLLQQPILPLSVNGVAPSHSTLVALHAISHPIQGDAHRAEVVNLHVQLRETYQLLIEATKVIRFLPENTGQEQTAADTKQDYCRTQDEEQNDDDSSSSSSFVRFTSRPGSARASSKICDSSSPAATAFLTSTSCAISRHPAYEEALAIPAAWPLVFVLKAIEEEKDMQEQGQTFQSRTAWPSSPLPFLTRLQSHLSELTTRLAHLLRHDHSTSIPSCPVGVVVSSKLSNFVLSNFSTLTKLVGNIPAMLLKYAQTVAERRRRGEAGTLSRWREAQKGHEGAIRTLFRTQRENNGADGARGGNEQEEELDAAVVELTRFAECEKAMNALAIQSGSLVSIVQLRRRAVSYLSHLQSGVAAAASDATASIPYSVSLSNARTLRARSNAFTEMQQSVEELRSAVSSLESERDGLLTRLASATTDLSTRSHELEKIQIGLNAERYQHDQTKAELQSTRERLRETEQECKEMEEHGQRSREKLEAENAELRELGSKQSEAAASLQSGLTAAHTQLAALQRELTHAQKRESELREELQQQAERASIQSQRRASESESRIRHLEQELLRAKEQSESDRSQAASAPPLPMCAFSPSLPFVPPHSSAFPLVSVSIQFVAGEGDEWKTAVAITSCTRHRRDELETMDTRQAEETQASASSFADAELSLRSSLSSISSRSVSTQVDPAELDARSFGFIAETPQVLRKLQSRTAEWTEKKGERLGPLWEQTDRDGGNSATEGLERMEPIAAGDPAEVATAGSDSLVRPELQVDQGAASISSASSHLSSALPALVPSVLSPSVSVSNPALLRPLYCIRSAPRVHDEIDPNDLWEEEEDEQKEKGATQMLQQQREKRETSKKEKAASAEGKVGQTDDGRLTSSSPPSPQMSQPAPARVDAAPKADAGSGLRAQVLLSRLARASDELRTSQSLLRSSDAKSTSYFLQLQQVASLLHATRSSYASALSAASLASAQVSRLKDELQSTKSNYETMNIELTEKVCQLTEQLAIADSKTPKQTGRR
jgi:DNA repair exonuclease SbcCD ATPase subunit